MRKWLRRIGVLAAAMLAAAPGVLAQGCAMCYADAAAQSPHARRQLDLAILTLLVPSVLMFAGVLIAAFRRREHDAFEGRKFDGIATTSEITSAFKRRPVTPGPAPDTI